MNANVKEVHGFKIGAMLVDGDRSVVEMNLEVTTVNGYRIRLEEVEMQAWKNERIIHERYSYDPSSIQDNAKKINTVH